MPEDKLRISERLAQFGVHFIEGGWPAAHVSDRVFFERARTELSSSVRDRLVVMAALGDFDAGNLASCETAALLFKAESGSMGVAATIFDGQGTWLEGMGTDDLAKVVSHLKKDCAGQVFVQLHNYFEAYAADASRAASIVQACEKAGASFIVLVDGPGGAVPWDIAESIKATVAAAGTGTRVGIACHDEADLAIASTIEGVKHGVTMVQGSINGQDRTANLAAVVPTMQLRMGRKVVGAENLKELTSLTRFLDEQCNQPHDKAAAFVGMSAFAHKGGIHVAAVLKNEDTYQHIDPTLVGNQRRVLISELSGRGNIMSKVCESPMP